MGNTPNPDDLSIIPDPWTWYTTDYQGKILRITINWDTSDGSIMSGVAYREPGCIYKTIYVGLSDTDGTVNGTPDQWTVPEGETLIRANILKKARIRNIWDVYRSQVTAGP